MLDDQPTRHARHAVDSAGAVRSSVPAGDNSATRTDADADAVAAALPGCFVCWLRDAADRAATARWLAAARRSRHEVLAVLCCPLHAWRLWEVSRPDSQSDRRASAESTDDARERHPQLAGMLAPAVGALARQLETVGEHFGDPGWRGRLTHLLGDRPPALLWERPPCPLCASHQRQAAEADEDALFRRFIEIYVDLPPDDRQRVAAGMCPRDRRLCQPYTTAFAELAPVPRRYAAGRLPEWWVPPMAGTEDRGFVTRLIEGDPRLLDDTCPACFVRAEHERALLAEIHRMGTSARRAAATSASEHAAREDVPEGNSGATGAVELEAIVEDLCPRHTALLRQGQGANVHGLAGVPAALAANLSSIPSRWPAGTLRAVTHESVCVLCTTLWGWNLARMEGMRRAAGSAALSEAITARLTHALVRRRYLFCLPHLQQITAPAPREVTLALLPSQRRGLDQLLGMIQTHADQLHPKPKVHRNRAGTRPTSDGEGGQTEPCWCGAAVAALAGEPG